MAKVTFDFDALTVWQASAYAYRLNTEYVKSGLNPEEKTTNRAIMALAIDDPSLLTDEDKALGEAIRKHYQAYTFKILKGYKLNDFDNNAMLISNRETITNSYELGVIAYLPYGYAKELKRNDVNQRIKFATGGYIGNVGDKVSATIEIIKTVYSHKFNTNYVTGITEKDEPVFFSCHNPPNLGDTCTVYGIVKAHRDNSTQLNRVKLS